MTVISDEPWTYARFNWDMEKEYAWGDHQELMSVNIYNSMKQLLVSISQFKIVLTTFAIT